MPNWCANNLTIEHGDRAKVMEFVHAYKEGKTCDHYLPVPRDGNGELITDMNHPDYWHTWCSNHWGTKWDIGSDNNEAHGLNPTIVGNQASMKFDSAWAPPIGLYEKLVELGFKVEATYWEPGMGFCGIWDNGDDNYVEYSHADKPEEVIPVALWNDYNMGEFFETEPA